MPTVDWQERISADPKVLVGKPVVKGTRVAVVVSVTGREPFARECYTAV